jgi:nucleotide-binding universal stress UspA family protein
VVPTLEAGEATNPAGEPGTASSGTTLAWPSRMPTADLTRSAAADVVSPPYRRVLCATDLSPSGDAAVRLAYRLVGENGSISLLHVCVPAWAPVGPPYPAAPSDDRMTTAERCAQEHLEGLNVREGRPDVSTEVVLLHHPNPAIAIASEARRAGMDAIVLGTHGRTGLGRLLLGSVATDVLKRAKVPVILFHDPHGEA